MNEGTRPGGASGSLQALKKPAIWLMAGVLLISFGLATSGLTFVSPQRVATAAEAETLFSHDGVYTPFGQFDFASVICTGLSLFYENESEEKPSDWIMLGELDGMLVPFLLAANGSTAEPEAQENVSYILRYPSSENRDYIELVDSELFAIMRDEFGYTRGDYDTEFLSTVFEAARSSRIQMLVFAVIGVVLLGVGLVILGVSAKSKREDELDMTGVSSVEGFVVESDGNKPFSKDKKDDPWE